MPVAPIQRLRGPEVAPGVTFVCDSMTVSDGAVRSHRTAPTHAVTTHPMPISPHHVINAIATPIGPNPFQPLSKSNDRNLWMSLGEAVR